MKNKSIVINVLVLLVIFICVGCSNNNQIEDETKKALNLGMTFEQFKNKYNEQSKKITQNDVGASLFMLFDENIAEHNSPANDYLCIFSFSDSNDVFLTVGIDEKTKNIWYINVLASADKSTTKDEIKTTLILQSTVYAIAVSVFNSKWENQSYRESKLKSLYDNGKSGKYEFIEDYIRYQIEDDDITNFPTLTIEAKNWFYNPY